MAGQAREQARKVEDRFNQAMRENPLAVGALAVGLGLVIGMALPRTEMEDEVFGRARDRILDKTKSSAVAAAEQGERKLSETAERAIP